MIRLGEVGLIQRLMPEHSRFRPRIKLLLVLVGIFLMCIAWSNPQWGLKREKVKRKSSDVFICLDISNSMLAQDLAPSRIARARKFSQKLVEKLEGDRVGVLVFAGNAYVHMPLTIDYSAAELFLDSASPEQILTQGTSFAAAIESAELSFEDNNDQYKALIIISDGENHDEEAIKRAEEARKKGVLIFTVGAGTEKGGYIPMEYKGYRDFKRDKNGELVMSKMNPESLKAIAEAGGGDYYNIVDGEEAVLASLEQKIKEIEKREFEERLFDEHESYYWIFLIPAFILLVIEFLISYRKSNILSGRDIL